MKGRRCGKSTNKIESIENTRPNDEAEEESKIEIEREFENNNSDRLSQPCEIRESNGRDHQKHSKRKANLSEIQNSEEKPPKTIKNNLTPESLPLVTTTPCTPLLSNMSLAEELFVIRKSHVNTNKPDYFGALPDEVLLMMFKFLPKPTLVNCACVSRRWKRIAYDSNLWRNVELSQRKLMPGSVGVALNRGPIIVRMSQTEVCSPIFQEFEETMENFVSKVEYLDLSMAIISPLDLTLLLKTCHSLRKLSLENCEVNENVCNEVANNPYLTVLNMSQCRGVDEPGVKSILTKCKKLTELNIAWTALNAAAIKCVCQFVPKEISRLNLSGCLKEISDSHVSALVIRCNKLKELDLSDSTLLTDLSVKTIYQNLKDLEILSLSRCYSIYPSSYTKLFILPSITHLNIFGLFHDSQIESLRKSSDVKVNLMRFSNIARPTVGSRRTSIWGLRVRD